MPKISKRMKSVSEMVDPVKSYLLPEAVSLVKKMANAKFDETVDIAIRLGVDATKADQMVRGGLTLPAGTGKTKRILVFAKGEKVREAEAAGADIVGQEELESKIKSGWLDFDVAVSTPDMMNVVGKLGKVLGPRGLMPSPKSGTVTFDLAGIIKEIRAGRVDFRIDKAGVVHAPIGKASFSEDALVSNAEALIETVKKLKPATSKGVYLRGISLSSTMGRSVRISVF